MRYVLEVMYDGTCFHGSQIQGETPTVQRAINNALSTVFREPVPTTGASRTDEGVHARCNYFHFDREVATDMDLRYKCNAILPDGVAIKRVCIATSPEFNARFDAIRRQYRYRIYSQKDPFLVNRALFYPFTLNKDILDKTAEIIMEHEQFESFSKRNAQSKTFNCKIYRSYWERNGEELHYVVEGNRFLRGMVRGLVATQIRVSRGKFSLEDFTKIIEARDCTKARFDVAGHGLYLESIVYPEGMLKEI